MEKNTKNFISQLKIATEELSTLPLKEKEEAFSENTRSLLEQRKNAIIKKSITAYNILNKRSRKSKKEDKTNMIIKTIDKDLDIRDRWLGIRQLKQECQPNPYARRTQEGKFIKQNQRAQEAANYFGKEQWETKEKNTQKKETALQMVPISSPRKLTRFHCIRPPLPQPPPFCSATSPVSTCPHETPPRSLPRRPP